MAIKLHRDLAANVLNGLIIILLVIGAIVFWGQHQFQTEGPTSAPVIVEINPNDKLITTSRAVGVADRLAEQGVIRYPWIFRLGARYLRVESDLKIGEYEIPAGASMKQVLNIINSGVGVTRNVTFPEGFSVFQIIARLNGVADLTGEVGDVPPEGSLAPNTYSYRKGEPRGDVIARMAKAQTDLLDTLWRRSCARFAVKNQAGGVGAGVHCRKRNGRGGGTRGCRFGVHKPPAQGDAVADRPHGDLWADGRCKLRWGAGYIGRNCRRLHRIIRI